VIVVLDASAVAKWFLVEDESGEMRSLREKLAGGEAEGYAPSLILVEVANLLRYARNVTSDDVKRALRSLEILLRLVDDGELLFDAVDLAFQNTITIYDSLYVELARRLDAYLVTYHEELLEKFRGMAVRASDLLRGR